MGIGVWIGLLDHEETLKLTWLTGLWGVHALHVKEIYATLFVLDAVVDACVLAGWFPLGDAFEIREKVILLLLLEF